MIRSVFGKHLNYAFCDRSQNVSVRIVERPGLWMSDSELASLVEDLRTIVKVSIPNESLDYGVLTGTREALSRAVITLIRDSKTNEPLAFNALAYMPCLLRGQPVDVLHLGLVVVSPTRREGGFSWILYGLTSILLFLRLRLRPLWVSNVTQVPAIIGKVTESFSEVFPTPEKDQRASFDHVILARQIMAKYRSVFGVGADAEFDEGRFVITNAYTGGSDHLKKKFEQAQAHRRSVYNEFCRENLNYDRGDDFLQLGKMDLASTQKYLTRSVPAKSLIAVSVSLVVVGIQGLFMPVVGWFDYRKHQGEIRPWS